jgi:peptide/nickel transport system permease protein
MRQDYIRTAWAKGVKERTILFRHAFRNSMIPIVTMIGGSVGGLIGGSVIMETLFNIPGIGNQLITALNQRDYPVVQGCVLVFSVFVMFVNIIVDMCYKWIDPRVELG